MNRQNRQNADANEIQYGVFHDSLTISHDLALDVNQSPSYFLLGPKCYTFESENQLIFLSANEANCRILQSAKRCMSCQCM